MCFELYNNINNIVCMIYYDWVSKYDYCARYDIVYDISVCWYRIFLIILVPIFNYKLTSLYLPLNTRYFLFRWLFARNRLAQWNMTSNGQAGLLREHKLIQYQNVLLQFTSQARKLPSVLYIMWTLDRECSVVLFNTY